MRLALVVAVALLIPISASAVTCEAKCTTAQGASTTVSCTGGSCTATDDVGVECTTTTNCGPGCTDTVISERTCTTGGGKGDVQDLEP